MAVWKVVETNLLSAGLVLAPERYHPRRELITNGTWVKVSDVALHVRETVTPERATKSGEPYRVLDTSDVFEGRVSGSVPVRDGAAIGSAKKLVGPGDVLVSRLRPYLRQVGYVDESLFDSGSGERCKVACSTEFLVLRAIDKESVAFLVPLLLTEPVQEVFASAVEGGHHPRFAPEVLLGLPIPQRWLEARELASAELICGIQSVRDSERSMASAIRSAGEAFLSS